MKTRTALGMFLITAALAGCDSDDSNSNSNSNNTNNDSSEHSTDNNTFGINLGDKKIPSTSDSSMSGIWLVVTKGKAEYQDTEGENTTTDLDFRSYLTLVETDGELVIRGCSQEGEAYSISGNKLVLKDENETDPFDLTIVDGSEIVGSAEIEEEDTYGPSNEYSYTETGSYDLRMVKIFDNPEAVFGEANYSLTTDGDPDTGNESLTCFEEEYEVTKGSVGETPIELVYRNIEFSTESVEAEFDEFSDGDELAYLEIEGLVYGYSGEGNDYVSMTSNGLASTVSVDSEIGGFKFSANVSLNK